MAFDKASFGGDRSAAGRYAAEQRWKGHTKGQSKKLSEVRRVATLEPENPYRRGDLLINSSALERRHSANADDFTKRIAEALVEKFSFVDLTEALIVQRTIGSYDAVKSVELFSAYKTELSKVKNAAEMSDVLENLSKQDNLKPRVFDSWREERLELIRLSGISHHTDDAMTQADVIVHGLKQGWTGGFAPAKGVFASVAREALGASSNRNEKADFERQYDKQFTDILKKYPEAKKVFVETFKQIQADTQEILKNILPEGTTHVRLFRGTALTDEQLKAAQKGLLDVSTISSWTVDREIATQFTGQDKKNTVGGGQRLTISVLTGVVPIGSVFGLNRQGFGTSAEAEVVVLGPSVEIEKVETGSALEKAPVRRDAMVEGALAKPSFGGYRSAGGRYAAERRWQNCSRHGRIVSKNW